MHTTTSFGPLGENVFNRTYSRRKDDGTKEVWGDTVRRVVRGNLALVPTEFHEDGESEKLVSLIEEFALLPAGRHLWVSGVEGRQFSFNCHHSGWGTSLSDHVGFLMNVLMTGGGSGTDYSNSAIANLPTLTGKVEVAVMADGHDDIAEFAHHLSFPLPSGGVVFKVDDSREGWVDALCVLTDLAENGGGSITFDVSDVRPRGSLIRGFGGTASGPAPLVELLTGVAGVLNQWVGGELSSLALMDIDHQIASCVIAGNVRRSARISIKHWADDDIFDFIFCKQDSSEHWSTNISITVDNDFFFFILGKRNSEKADHARSVLRHVVQGMLTNGEPGFWNSSLAGEGENFPLTPNPCGEIGLESWEPCCLGHVNLAHFGEDLSGAVEAARLMSRFLVRATFADIDDERQQEVVNRNRRLGLGILGFQEWGASHGFKYSEIHKSETMGVKLQMIKDRVREAADAYAEDLGIPAPIKVTAVAPTGSVSMLPGVTAGIHPIYARRFVRRIRFAEDDPAVEVYRAEGKTVESCVYTKNTSVVSFPSVDPIIRAFPDELIEQADEVSFKDMLATQAFVQEFFADNAVSFTVNVAEGADVEEVETALMKVLPRLKGTTIMVDGTRPQAPLERLSVTEYLSLSGDKVEVSQAMDECQTGACPIR